MREDLQLCMSIMAMRSYAMLRDTEDREFKQTGKKKAMLSDEQRRTLIKMEKTAGVIE